MKSFNFKFSFVKFVFPEVSNNVNKYLKNFDHEIKLKLMNQQR